MKPTRFRLLAVRLDVDLVICTPVAASSHEDTLLYQILQIVSNDSHNCRSNCGGLVSYWPEDKHVGLMEGGL